MHRFRRILARSNCGPFPGTSTVSLPCDQSNIAMMRIIDKMAIHTGVLVRCVPTQSISGMLRLPSPRSQRLQIGDEAGEFVVREFAFAINEIGAVEFSEQLAERFGAAVM